MINGVKGLGQVYKNTNCAFLIVNGGRDFVILTSKSISASGGVMLAKTILIVRENVMIIKKP